MQIDDSIYMLKWGTWSEMKELFFGTKNLISNENKSMEATQAKQFFRAFHFRADKKKVCSSFRPNRGSIKADSIWVIKSKEIRVDVFAIDIRRW